MIRWQHAERFSHTAEKYSLLNQSKVRYYIHLHFYPLLSNLHTYEGKSIHKAVDVIKLSLIHMTTANVDINYLLGNTISKVATLPHSPPGDLRKASAGRSPRYLRVVLFKDQSNRCIKVILPYLYAIIVFSLLM